MTYVLIGLGLLLLAIIAGAIYFLWKLAVTFLAAVTKAMEVMHH